MGRSIVITQVLSRFFLVLEKLRAGSFWQPPLKVIFSDPVPLVAASRNKTTRMYIMIDHLLVCWVSDYNTLRSESKPTPSTGRSYLYIFSKYGAESVYMYLLLFLDATKNEYNLCKQYLWQQKESRKSLVQFYWTNDCNLGFNKIVLVVLNWIVFNEYDCLTLQKLKYSLACREQNRIMANTTGWETIPVYSKQADSPLTKANNMFYSSSILQQSDPATCFWCFHGIPHICDYWTMVWLR